MGDSVVRPLNADEPTVIGPYRLLGRLGSGGMGRVYLGRSAGGRTVAVKVVHPHFALDEEFRIRFRREVAAARKVGGAWTAPVLDADPEATVPWVATGYVAGPSLSQAVTGPRGGPLPEAALRVLGAGLAEALSEVHARGLVHRDVKPSNVLLALDGPRLIDFGIARAVDGTASLTSTGASIGSPGYMAPEQILGDPVTGAADVFSLGSVLVYAASGKPPFPGDTSAALLYKVVHAEPQLGHLQGELRDLAARCLAKDPATRPTPADLLTALAPDGVRELTRDGWLPAHLIEHVSRTAVGLLDLDADTEPGGGAEGSGGRSGEPGGRPGESGGHPGESRARPGGLGGRSGGLGAHAEASVPGESASSAPGGAASSAPGAPAAPVPATPNTEPPPPLGVFGPPDPSYGPAPTWPPAPAGQPSYAFGGDTGSGSAGPGGVGMGSTGAGSAGPGGAGPDGATGAGTSPPAGKLSLTVDTASTPTGPNNRGRRLSCTVALAVAGALAAVTVGSVFAFDLLSGPTDNAADGGPQQTATPPTGQQPNPSATPSPVKVPAAYLGTWEGPATARTNGLPLGSFRLTVKQGGPGDTFAVLRATDPIGGVCEVDLRLRSTTPEKIVASAQGRADSAAVCTKNEHTVHLVLTGQDLTYVSENQQAGKPKSRMEKVG